MRDCSLTSAVTNRLRRRTSDQMVLGLNPAVAAALSPWTRLFTPIVPRRSLHISFYYLSGHPCKIYTGKKKVLVYNSSQFARAKSNGLNTIDVDMARNVFAGQQWHLSTTTSYQLMCGFQQFGGRFPKMLHFSFFFFFTHFCLPTVSKAGGGPAGAPGNLFDTFKQLLDNAKTPAQEPVRRTTIRATRAEMKS